MNYARILSPHHIAALHDWLAESGELYIQIGSNDYDRTAAKAYFITELGQLKTLLNSQSLPSFAICIFRGKQFPIRGNASQSMMDEVLRIIPAGGWYTIVSLDAYPQPIYHLGAGKDYSTLRQEITELEGQTIAIGVEPMDADYGWPSMLTEPVKVMYFAASENVESYEEYTENPKQYEEIVKSWDDPFWP